MSTKIKNSSNNLLSQASQSVDPTQMISSVGAADVFNDILMNSTQVDVNSGGAGNKQSQEQTENIQNVSTVRNKTLSKTSGSKSSEKADSDEVSNVSVNKNQDADTVEEDREIESYEVSVQNLAQQLNVVVQQIFPAMNSAQNQASQIQLKAASSASSGLDVNVIRTMLEGVNKNLLRRVDLESLAKKLEQMMKKTDVAQIEAPLESPALLPQDLQQDIKNEGSFDLKSFQELIDQVTQGLQVEKQVIHEEETLRENLVVVADQNQTQVEDDSFSTDTANLIQQSDFQITPTHENKDIDPFLNVQTNFVAHSQAPLVDNSERISWNSSAYLFDDKPINPSQIKHVNLSSMIVPVSHQSSFNSGKPTAIKLSENGLSELQNRATAALVEITSSGRSGKTRIQMWPPELGKLDIHVRITGDKVEAEIITDNKESQQFLQKQISTMRDTLLSEGFRLDSFLTKHDENHFKQQQNAELPTYNQQQSQQRKQQGELEHTGNDREKSVMKQAKKIQQIRDGLLNVTI